jgi:hypothetical protein
MLKECPKQLNHKPSLHKPVIYRWRPLLEELPLNPKLPPGLLLRERMIREMKIIIYPVTFSFKVPHFVVFQSI